MVALERRLGGQRIVGRVNEARAEFERAAALTRNARERQLLLHRAEKCAGAPIDVR